MKATAKSPSNIAFIKYWGKADPKTRIPQNNSISMTLSDLYSICTVDFDRKYKKDEIEFLKEKIVQPEEIKRIKAVLDRVRRLAKTDLKARVVTMNNFPKATGIASSASGLSAVTLAAAKSIGLDLSKMELSRLARLASGTASRSISDGFVEWEKGTNKNNSYARQIFPPDWWDLRDVVAIVTSKMKKIKSTEGHALADTSPFQKIRIAGMDQKIKIIKKAIKDRNFSTFGHIVEAECLSMHAVCLTSRPPILYWNPVTVEIMRKIRLWRANKEMEAFFTIDAGPTVHIICEGKNSRKLVNKLKGIKGIQRLSVNKPALGVRAIKKHLF